MINGQLVFGPAGSGKTTYCWEVIKLPESIELDLGIINLDPSTKRIFPRNCIDLRQLINSNDVMKELSLGPNGSLLFCMEFLMDNLFWLKQKIEMNNHRSYIIDMPGQIELFSHSNITRQLIIFLESECDLIINGLFFIDSHFISDPGKFIAVSISGLSFIFSLEIPHFNVMTKVDLIENLPRIIIERFSNPCLKKIEKDLECLKNFGYRKLNINLLRLIEDFGMISYIPLDITDNQELVKFFREVRVQIE